MSTSAILIDVEQERQRQDEKWGPQTHSPAAWLAILGEEFGEVAKPVADHATAAKSFDAVAYRRELIHVAAVAVAAVETLDHGTTVPTHREAPESEGR